MLTTVGTSSMSLPCSLAQCSSRSMSLSSRSSRFLSGTGSRRRREIRGLDVESRCHVREHALRLGSCDPVWPEAPRHLKLDHVQVHGCERGLAISRLHMHLIAVAREDV